MFRRNDELFGENSWVQVMMGQGILPERHHPIAEKLGDDELDRLLSMLRRNVADAAATMPPHAEYVARYCPAEDRPAAAIETG